jgi:predicted ATPase
MTNSTDLESGYDPHRVEQKRDQFILISGCSGSGKSSLLAELGRRGFNTFEEPGRQIVKEQLHVGGDALPWSSASKFIDLVISRAMHQMITAARGDGIAFFDRGIVDAVTALQRLNLAVPEHYLRALEKYRYHRKVFLSPPWPEIYRNDGERRHSFEDAKGEYEALEAAYALHGYEVVVLPKSDVHARADFVMTIVAPGG